MGAPLHGLSKADRRLKLSDAPNVMHTDPENTWTVDAISRGDIEAIRQRVAEDATYLSERDFQGDTPLETAVAAGNLEVVEFLLDAGADPNADVDDGCTSLLTAVSNNHADSLEIMRRLLSAGAKIDERGMNGWTPLHAAAASGDVEKARMLIQLGAEVDCRKDIDGGETPLMEAAFHGCPEMVSFLLGAGADASLRDWIHDRTPLEMAKTAGIPQDPELTGELLRELESELSGKQHQKEMKRLRREIARDLKRSGFPRERPEDIVNEINADGRDVVELFRESMSANWRTPGHDEVVRILQEHNSTGPDMSTGQHSNRPEEKPARSLIDQLTLFVATGLGIGFIPVMPGTFGSLWGPVWVWGVEAADTPWPVYVLLSAVLIGIGLPICARAGRLLGLVDPGSIVYDEIVAFPLVFAPLQLSGGSVGWITGALGFLWFRLFDILKPWPIRRFERLPGAYGVMADDLVAGVFAGVALWGTMQLVPL